MLILKHFFRHNSQFLWITPSPFAKKPLNSAAFFIWTRQAMLFPGAT